MKTLTIEQMESVYAGKNGCGVALIGLGLSLVGTFASFATLNPIGTIIGVGGIYTGFAGVAISCGEPVVE